jgi:hypothetical protein
LHLKKKWNQKQYYKLTLVVLSIIYLLVVFGFAILSYNTVSSDAKKALGNKAMVLAVDIAEHLDLDGQEYERLLSLDFDQLLKDPVNIEFEQKARAVMKYADIKYSTTAIHKSIVPSLSRMASRPWQIPTFGTNMAQLINICLVYRHYLIIFRLCETYLAGS